MAFRRKIKDTLLEESAEQPPSSGWNRGGLILLLCCNLLAAGSWGYLKFYEGPKVEKEQKRAARRIVAVKKTAVDLMEVVNTIMRRKLEAVTDPGTIIDKAAAELGVLDNIKTGKANSHAFRPNPNFNEITTEVTNAQQSGYKLYDIVRLAQRIESKNPKIKIKNIKFGIRDKGQGTVEDDNWRPAGRFLVVRAFAPRSDARR